MPDPLPHYRLGDSWFSSGRGCLLGQGVADVVRPAAAPALARELAAAFACARASGQDDPVVVGALGFAPGTPSHLVVPQRVMRSGARAATLGAPRRGTDGPAADGVDAHGRSAPAVSLDPLRVEEVPSGADYMASVRRALALAARGELRKVVLSRTLELTAAADVDVPALLAQLLVRDPRAFTFAVDLPADGADRRTLVGSSPELLVSRDGDTVTAMPLAGTAARSPDAQADRERASVLVGSPKDLREHAVVVEAVVAGLRELCTDVCASRAPHLVRTPTLWHLGTSITGTLRDRATTSLDLALALHPTPAVGGAPLDAARAAIADLEGFDRGYFTGTVGWCDESGDGEWAVTIRCAEVEGARLRLFAGAGIVPGSRPEAELAETAAKFRTMLRALGLPDDVAAPAALAGSA